MPDINTQEAVLLLNAKAVETIIYIHVYTEIKKQSQIELPLSRT